MWQLAGSFVLMGPEGAVDRGQWIWQAERAVHLPSETAVQAAFLPHPLIVQALNLYYAGLHFVVVIGCLIWVYVWHRRHYPQVRTTLVLFTAAALLVQFIPVAPPRMLPGDGMIDTAAALRAVGLRLGGRVQRRSAVGDAVGACRVGAAGRPGDR